MKKQADTSKKKWRLCCSLFSLTLVLLSSCRSQSSLAATPLFPNFPEHLLAFYDGVAESGEVWFLEKVDRRQDEILYSFLIEERDVSGELPLAQLRHRQLIRTSKNQLYFGELLILQTPLTLGRSWLSPIGDGRLSPKNFLPQPSPPTTPVSVTIVSLDQSQVTVEVRTATPTNSLLARYTFDRHLGLSSYRFGAAEAPDNFHHSRLFALGVGEASPQARPTMQRVACWLKAPSADAAEPICPPDSQ